MALPGENQIRHFSATLSAMSRLLGRLILLLMVGAATLLFAQQTQQAQQPTDAPASPGDDVDLTAEVQQLRQEVDRLRRELARVSAAVDALLAAESAPAEKPAPPPPPPAQRPSSGKSAAVAPEVEEKVPSTVFVLRDGHRTEATNYAIIGQTVWIYSEQDAKKIPLADLDLAATKSANADHGVAFQLPPTK
jgi:hypothetical protein